MDLQQQYRTGFRELAEKLGRNPNSNDPEWWALSDGIRKQYQERVDARIRDSKRPVEVSILDIKCVECKEIFQKRPGKGRSPKTCYKCRGME